MGEENGQLATLLLELRRTPFHSVPELFYTIANNSNDAVTFSVQHHLNIFLKIPFHRDIALELTINSSI